MYTRTQETDRWKGSSGRMSPHLEESPHGAAAADGDQIRYSAGLDAAIGRPPLVTGEGGIGNR